jgi:DNA-directed RNA polymerase subunit RPC12/RpoP
MKCTRCGGLMVREQFQDHGGLGSSDHEYAGLRCINCGAIVDPVIAAHRRLASQATASNPALTTV